MSSYKAKENVGTLTVFPELSHKLVSRLVQQCGHIVIQGVHVLHQPFISFIVHLKKHSHSAELLYWLDKKSTSKHVECVSKS